MERYFAQFMARDGLVRRWSVYDDKYSGEPIELTLAEEGILIRENNSEGGFVPIRTWSGFVNILDKEGNLSDLYAANVQSLSMELTTENGEVEWSGFVNSETRAQPYPSNMSVIQIPICGKLNTAGGYNLEEREGISNLGELLHEALILCGYTDSDYLRWPNTYAVPGCSSGLSLLALSVTRSLFYSSDKERVKVQKGDAYDTPITSTAEEVLSEIAKLFGYTWYERRGVVTAVSRFESSYVKIPIGQLKEITGASSGEIVDADMLLFDQLETNKQRFYKLHGKHSVTVDLDLEKIHGNLIDFNVDKFAYVAAYKRPLDYSRPRGGRKFIFTQVFECDNLKDIRTYAYYRNSHEESEDFKTGWLPLDTIESGKWWYGEDQGRESKPGCFPAKISIADENPYYDENRPGSPLNRWIIGNQFNDGFIFNPAYYENGDCGFITNKYPIIKFHKKSMGIYSKGTFALNFNVGAFPVCAADRNSPDPVTPFCRFGVTLRVGEYKYMNIHHSDAGGSWNEWGWVKTTDEPTKLSVMTVIDSENSFPSSMSVKDTRGSGRFPNRAVPNVTGMAFPIWDKDGNETVISGDIEMTLFADSNDAITGDNKKTKPRLLFISNLSLEFISEDQYPDGYVPESNEKERKLHRLTNMGFSTGEDVVKLRMGSQAADNSTSLSAILYNGEGLQNVTRLSDNVSQPPEEFLLDELHKYNNQIVERRELTTKQGLKSDIDTISMDGDFWRQVAITEDYGKGTQTVTIENA